MHIKIINPLTAGELINEIHFNERSYLRRDLEVQNLLQNAKSEKFDVVCCCKNTENILLTLSHFLLLFVVKIKSSAYPYLATLHSTCEVKYCDNCTKKSITYGMKPRSMSYLVLINILKPLVLQT
jgi:hypothetical protein